MDETKPRVANVFLLKKGREMSGGPMQVEVQKGNDKVMRQVLVQQMKQRDRAAEWQIESYSLRIHHPSDGKLWFEYSARRSA